jgi:hypothetical protein
MVYTVGPKASENPFTLHPQAFVDQVYGPGTALKKNLIKEYDDRNVLCKTELGRSLLEQADNEEDVEANIALLFPPISTGQDSLLSLYSL